MYLPELQRPDMRMDDTTEPTKRLHVAPKTGIAFTIKKGQVVRIIDVQGGQVADLLCCSKDEKSEVLSSGHTIDYNGKLFLSKGDILYSSKSNPMFTILADQVGRHIMLYAPCSQEMFAKSYGVTESHPNCFDNLAANLKDYGIQISPISIPLNIFMNIEINPAGEITIGAPVSKAGDAIELRAEMDMIVGLAACSAGLCNNFEWTPIEVQIFGDGK
jgi:uncharacterized protein YcgI (DUF1989 family)